MRPKIILCLFFLSGLLFSCRSEQSSAAPKEALAIPVIASLPQVKDVTVYLEAIGSFKASVTMDIKSQVSGTISKVLVKEGEFVRKGTLLFVIDKSLYESKVKEAEAQMSMDLAWSAVAEKKMERFRKLAERDLIAGIEWDDLETELAKAKAMVELDAARLRVANLDLDHCQICSPINGRIGKLDVHPGVLVSPGGATTLASIVKVNPLTLEFHVTEKEYAKMSSANALWDQKEEQIELYSPCAAGFCTSGKITFLDNHFDSKTGTMLVRGTVQNEDRLLKPGQTIRVKVPIGIIHDAHLIPQKAIRYNQQGPYAYVVLEDNTVALRQLVLDVEEGNDQIVKQGIERNERVIVDGHLRLSPGVKVDVKE